MTLRSGHIQDTWSMAICLLVAVSVAACEPSEGQLFGAALPTVHGDPLPVALRDATGLVTGIEPSEVDPRAGSEFRVESDPADPSALIVSWTGGLCDADATFSFWGSDSTYNLHLAVRLKPGSGCPAAGVPRGLRIETSSPIPADSILVSGWG
jgi:hypothetical protein